MLVAGLLNVLHSPMGLLYSHDYRVDRPCPPISNLHFRTFPGHFIRSLTTVQFTVVSSHPPTQHESWSPSLASVLDCRGEGPWLITNTLIESIR